MTSALRGQGLEDKDFKVNIDYLSAFEASLRRMPLCLVLDLFLFCFVNSYNKSHNILIRCSFHFKESCYPIVFGNILVRILEEEFSH